MNEQIKQLWEEAAKTTQSDSWEEQTKFMERFAELIVKECMEINKQELSFIAFETLMDRYNEHFGVKE